MTQVPVIPENAPFDAAQRIWLNGFLAGLFAQSRSETGASTSSSTERPPLPLLVIYGSQTGTAEGLARRIAAEANRLSFKSRVLEASVAPAVDWSKESHLLIVT